MTDTRACGCAWSTSHTYGCPTGGGRVNSPEPPAAAKKAAANRLYAYRWEGDPTEGQFVSERMDECEEVASLLLTAALPHLLTEVKSMCETATALGLTLGRKEAGAEAAKWIEDHHGPDPSPASPTWWAGYSEAQQDCARIVRDMASQPPQPVSNGLTASSRHPGTPEAPEAVKTRRAGECSQCFRDYDQRPGPACDAPYVHDDPTPDLARSGGTDEQRTDRT